MTTARRLLRSGSAATLAQAVRILSLQATHVVVRRWIGPDEWGVWWWLEVVFLLLASLRDLGVPTHVLRSKPMPLGTLLRVELAAGTLLAALVVVGAPLLAHLFHGGTELVVAGLRALALYLVLEGLSAVALCWFEGRLTIERTLPAELARTFTYCAGVLAGAAAGWGFWSFVAAQLAGQAVFCALLWIRARGEIELVHAPGSTASIVRASLPPGWIWLLATAVTYVDALVVGRLFASEVVGLYAAGYGYAFLVTRILQQPIGRSLYPALIAEADDRAAQFRVYRIATVLFLAIEVPVALLLASNPELVITILTLGAPRWLAAAPFLQLLAFAPIADPLGRFGGELLVARHHDRARIVALVVQLGGLLVVGIGLSLGLGTPFGMAIANLLPFGSIVVLLALRRDDHAGELARLGRELAFAYLTPLLPFALVWLATEPATWLRFGSSFAAAVLTAIWHWRRHGEEYRGFFAAGRAAV